MVGGLSTSGSALSGKNSNQKQFIFKPKLHPKSLLKEGVSTMRFLAEQSQSIFQIIMPWRQEQEDEEKKRLKKLRHQAEIKQASLTKWVKTKPKEEEGVKHISKEEEKYQQQLYDGELDEGSDDYHRLQKVIKVKEVEKVKLEKYA